MSFGHAPRNPQSGSPQGQGKGTHAHGPLAAGQPAFRDLSRDEMISLLARNHVGRVAFTLHDRVNIQPVHYVYNDGWLYGRTSPGTKLSTIAHQPWVAVEVDEVRDLFDWISVVVHGKFDVLDATWHQPDTIQHAVSLMRHVIPETLTGSDPVPFRTVLFRIHANEMTGRACILVPPGA
jgi:nitroimidazol reductase NimA-like FMN-containing flavoprotein (pyridoxamine 5'-phosphate oxidase superfamily)